MVVFGAGGDMTKRLLIPALYNLSRTKLLPEKFALIGVDLEEARPRAGATTFTTIEKLCRQQPT